MASLNFNAANVQPSDSFAPLPAGAYIAQITNSEIKPTKSGTGMVLNLTWTVLDGQFVNRKIFGRINVQNSSPKAEEIGQRELSAVCHATGVMQLQDSNQLHGRPCKITVKIRQDEQYGDSNEIKSYESAGAIAPQGAAAAPAPWSAPSAPAAAPAAPSAPWAKQAA